MQLYSVPHFGEPSITQEQNSTFAAFEADNATIACPTVISNALHLR
jgi:hypothetical protein